MEEKKYDIQSRADIERLVNQFYKKVISDEMIGVFFTEIVVLDWGKHIPVMYDFWETILLGKRTYKGNAMLKHIQLSRKQTLQTRHFERWLKHWETTVQECFCGEKAHEAIERAHQIGALMQTKIARHLKVNGD